MKKLEEIFMSARRSDKGIATVFLDGKGHIIHPEPTRMGIEQFIILKHKYYDFRKKIDKMKERKIQRTFKEACKGKYSALYVGANSYAIMDEHVEPRPPIFSEHFIGISFEFYRK